MEIEEDKRIKTKLKFIVLIYEEFGFSSTF